MGSFCRLGSLFLFNIIHRVFSSFSCSHFLRWRLGWRSIWLSACLWKLKKVSRWIYVRIDRFVLLRSYLSRILLNFWLWRSVEPVGRIHRIIPLWLFCSPFRWAFPAFAVSLVLSIELFFGSFWCLRWLILIIFIESSIIRTNLLRLSLFDSKWLIFIFLLVLL